MPAGVIDLGNMPDDLKEALGEALHHALGSKKARKRGWQESEKPLPEARILRIKEAADIYKRSLTGCPYGPGDWVTPRDGYAIKGHGHPYMVVDINPMPTFIFDPEGSGQASDGRRPDMRVLTLIDGEIVCFWCESYQYEEIDIDKYMNE